LKKFATTSGVELGPQKVKFAAAELGGRFVRPPLIRCGSRHGTWGMPRWACRPERPSWCNNQAALVVVFLPPVASTEDAQGVARDYADGVGASSVAGAWSHQNNQEEC